MIFSAIFLVVVVAEAFSVSTVLRVLISDVVAGKATPTDVSSCFFHSSRISICINRLSWERHAIAHADACNFLCVQNKMLHAFISLMWQVVFANSMGFYDAFSAHCIPSQSLLKVVTPHHDSLLRFILIHFYSCKHAAQQI